MFKLAFKNLFQDKVRLIISVLGVSLPLLLIIVLLGIYNGFLEQSTLYIDGIDGDLWVAQEGTHDMFHTFSLLPVNIEGKLESFAEIERAFPLIVRTTAFKFRGVKNNISVIGISEDNFIGQPNRIIEGYDMPDKEEIIVDQVTFKKNNFSLGDIVRFGSDEEEGYDDLDEYRIIGVSKDTNLLVFQYAFIDYNDAQKILGTDQAVNFYIVKAMPGVDVENLKKKIEKRIDKTIVFTKEEWSQNNADIVIDGFLPIISVIVIIGFIIGIAIIGLVVYTTTAEKTREFGILKAIGTSNFRLYLMVIFQAIIMSVIGYALAVVFSFFVDDLIEARVITMRVSILPEYYYYLFYTGIAMAIISAYIPIKRVSKVDPAIVFKS